MLNLRLGGVRSKTIDLLKLQFKQKRRSIVKIDTYKKNYIKSFISFAKE